MSRSEGDDELLTAYLDGVAELTPVERKRAEATLDPADAAATRALLDQLRALPPESAREPDWAAMARSIRATVGDRVPRPWWRPAWTWALPAVAATAAVIAIVVATGGSHAPAPVAHRELAAPAHAVATPAVEGAPLVYLDGEALDIDAVDPAVLDEALPDVADEESLVPTDHWVDRLDARALEHVARALAAGEKG